MLTLLSRPQGHKLSNPGPYGSVSQAGGEALVTTTFAHGLVDGDWIYVESNIQSYNGFLQVDQTAYNQFKMIRRGIVVPFRQLADITYRVSVLDHGFQAVHNPIVYEFENDLYPSNEADTDYTPITVVSTSSEVGYTRLALSAGIALLQELDYIRVLSGTAAGVYQVTRVFEQWNIVIDRLYNASDTYGQVVREYKNYVINVNLYAGLPADHPWVDEKPFELAASLKFTPDASNKIKFSVSDTLRGHINTRNNLLLDTLPNNLDFTTGFYIDYFESYDKSDGATITTQEGDVTTDDFVGYALNAQMPFKQGSFMNDYLSFDTYLAQWLVLNPSPLTLVGRFFDMSFINSIETDNIEIFVNGELNQTILNPGIGIIRVPFTFDTAGQKCIYAHVPASGVAPTLQIITSWVNAGVYPSLPWTVGSPHPWEASVNGNGGLQDYIVGTFVGSVGVAYPFTINTTLVNTGGATPNFLVRCMLLDASFNILAQDDVVYTTYAASRLHSMTLTPSANTAYFGITCINNTVVATKTIELNNATFDGGGGGTVTEQTLTETICVTVLEECEDTLIEGEARLLEDGEFRLLE